MLREKNIDTGVEKKDENKTGGGREGREDGQNRKTVAEVDRRSLAELSVQTNEKEKKGEEFYNDTSLLLGFPLYRDKLIKI